MSRKIKVGDRILKVDDTAVDAKGTDVTKLLLGVDIPGYYDAPFKCFVHDDPAMAQASVDFQSFACAGSIVNISFQRQGAGAIEVSLKRACTTDLADRRSLACRLPPATVLTTVLDLTVT